MSRPANAPWRANVSTPDLEPLDPAALDEVELAVRIHGRADARAEEAELCRRFARRIRLYGLRHLGGEEAAADLVQRVLMVTLEKLRAGRVREPERIASFVLGTARMLSHELRRGATREDRLEDAALHDVFVEARTPDPIARDRLSRALDTLPPREQSVLTLSYYAEQTTDEVARALGISAGNVRVIRHRAVARLREALGVDEGAAR